MTPLPSRRGRRPLRLSLGLLLLATGARRSPLHLQAAMANPASNPYIPYRTDPTDQHNGGFVDHALDLAPDPTVSHIRSWEGEATTDSRCQIRFSLGIGKRVHGDWNAPIMAAPVVYPVLPGAGPGRQVLLNHYEHLDLLSPSSVVSSSSSSSRVTADTRTTPTHKGPAAAVDASSAAAAAAAAVKEILLQAPEYPLLLEGSMFWTTPLLSDVDGDGRPDAILTDSEGGIVVMGLSSKSTPATEATSTTTASSSFQSHAKHLHRRTFQTAQVPRLFVRREWVERRVQHASGIVTTPPPSSTTTTGENNKTTMDDHHKAATSPDDPYHSYFEYYHTEHPDQQDLLRGVSANWWNLDSHDRIQWRQRQKQQRSQKHHHRPPQDSHEHPTQSEEERSGAHGGASASSAAHEPPNDPNEQQQQQQQQQHDNIPKPPPVDDFVGDDLEYMLAKEREAEQRGVNRLDDDDNDVDLDLRQGAVQRRRRLQEEEKAEGAGAAEVPHQDEQPKDGNEGQHPPQHDVDPPQGKVNDPPEHHRDEERTNSASAGVEGGAHDPQYTHPDAPLREADSGIERVEERGLYYDDLAADGPPDGKIIDVDRRRAGDDIANDVAPRDDPEYGMKYDDYYRRGYGGLDDEYRGRNDRHREYYDAKHYIRVPPHVLCTPVLAELPKLYTNTDEKEDILFIAVSYFLDEDEYQGLTGYKRFVDSDRGDETEAARGMYVASAIMAYILGDSPRWTGQTHLDLSTDYTAPENLTVVGALPIRADATRMGAFALGSPTVADVDGDGNMEVLLGTSMGIVYAFDARQMYKKAKFPIQMPYPVESRILVEDVRGNTNLEIFVADTGGNVICFSHEANPLWHRNLATSVGLRSDDVKGTSPMALGDLNGDGVMDLAMAIFIDGRSFVFALNAATGEDLPHFPIELNPSHAPKLTSENLSKKLVQPLLVDLHQDQTFLSDYLRRNGTSYIPRKAKSPIPGQSLGLHIVYPQSQYLHIIEAGSGCSQIIQIGDPISAMVQVDDVHGTNRLDLVVTTEAGDVITLESPSPYHPLNTWNQGELRGRMNGHAHGYSASQGIFVHEVSRQYIDVFGVYVPITFEIFDNRPNIANEPEKRQYTVEVRDGTSSKRVLFRAKYEVPGLYTERVYVRYGPGYYTLHVVLITSHGLLYEDAFQIGYNVRFMNGFGILLWLPLLAASATILLFGSKKSDWDEADGDSDRETHTLGILGRSLPS